MTRVEAVARIHLGLGFRSDQTTNIQSMLIEAQRLLEMMPMLPYFLLTEDSDLDGEANSPDVTLPSDFLREDENERVRFIETSGRVSFMEKGDFEALTNNYQKLADADQVTATTTTVVRAYALRLATIRVFPKPTVDYTVRMSYYAKQAVLNTDGATNLWLSELYMPEVLIGFAGMRMAGLLRDKDAVSEFKVMYDIAWASVQAKSIERELASRDVRMGSQA